MGALVERGLPAANRASNDLILDERSHHSVWLRPLLFLDIGVFENSNQIPNTWQLTVARGQDLGDELTENNFSKMITVTAKILLPHWTTQFWFHEFVGRYFLRQKQAGFVTGQLQPEGLRFQSSLLLGWALENKIMNQIQAMWNMVANAGQKRDKRIRLSRNPVNYTGYLTFLVRLNSNISCWRSFQTFFQKRIFVSFCDFSEFSKSFETILTKIIFWKRA